MPNMEDGTLGIPMEYIVNHVFLPPKLPQLCDTTPEVEVALTKLLHDALNEFIGLLPEEVQHEWIALPHMLSILLDTGSLGSPIRNLDRELDGMVEGDVLALHITRQNAGVILRKHAQTLSYEAFELSPKSAAVTGTTGRVVRKFPGPVIAISDTRVRDHNFRKAFTQCLMSIEEEVLEDAASKGYGKYRDTVHPKFATEYLPGVLRGIGAPLEVSRIYKRTRDDVLWGDGAEEPWRRSPRWTLLRVAMQTTIVGPQGDHTRYKIFMIYFMATLLGLAVTHDFSNDLLHVMLAKINRRNQKLNFIIPEDAPWALEAHEFVTEKMDSTHRLLVERWSTIQKSAISAGTFRLAELKKLKPSSDTILGLPNLRVWLEQLHNNVLQPRDENIFKANCRHRIDGRGSSLPDPLLLHPSAVDPTSIDPASKFELRLALLDIELWAAHSLDSWLARNATSSKRLVELSKLITWYMSAAKVYAGSPENFSVMTLTVMLLWTALDKAAVSRYPLLRKFDPGFPTTLLDSLFLPKRFQMIQLRDIEKYLEKRKTNALPGNPSIFGDISSHLSFGAQYFDQSPTHQNLRTLIEREAKEGSREKKAELKEIKSQYSKLMAKSDALACTYITKAGRGRNRVERTVMDPHCSSCRLRKEAESLKISCYEWPLPTSEPAAKAVIFELEIPSVIRRWRATTYQILADVLNPSPPPRAKSKSFTLAEYEGLARHLKSRVDTLRLASSTKPLAQTQSALEATEDSICRPNSLSLFMQDSRSQHKTTEHLTKFDIQDRCTLKLPRGSYESLQYAVTDTEHTSNEVISSQGACPDGLTVHEVHAFAALRSGHRLQWLNIARELVSRTLDSGKEEVHLLLLQASCQAGPSALHQISRDSHIELEEESFGHDLLSTLEAGLISVESNWQGSIAALTFISLATRLLSLSLDESVLDRCLKFLEKARKITVEWLRVVVQLLHKTADEKEMAYLTLRVLDLALICHCTFDIESRHLPSLLSSADNVAILVETAIIVHDRYPISEEPLTTLTRELLRRFSRTSHTLEAALKEQILVSSDGIDSAMTQIWKGYKPGMPWAMVQTPNDRWLTTQTAGSARWGNSLMTVHFNTLTGSLLVNGRPLSRLPYEYSQHSNYRRLFGNKILEVFPSSKGLHFETRNSIDGFQVHFALHGKELIVRASKGFEMYEAIPVYALEEDFPRTLVDNYVHWIHRATMAIEFRPIETKWFPSSENWHILTPEDPDASSLVLKNKSLVDPQSPTATEIYRWLKPLESSANITIFYNDATEETEVRLPRMNLDFILRKNGLDSKKFLGLESKQFRGMVVDTNQHFGAFHGLLHKLILKDTRGPARVVIVPHGTVSFHRTDQHVQVSIATGVSGDKVPYHQFTIDKELGMLKDNGNLHSRLFKLYLHALTSHCLPDTLTGRTGCEEALHGLRLASTRSFLSLDPENVDQLRLFARLSPARDFYPRGSKFMQQVNFENLSPLSHHESFIEEVRLMLDQAEAGSVFEPKSNTRHKIENRGARELQYRAAIRNAFHRSHPFGAEKFTSSFDAVYEEARDSIPNSPREHEACYVAGLVDKWSCNLDPYINLFEQIRSLGPIIYEPQSDFEFKFKSRWLDNPGSFIPQYWCSMQLFLSKADATKDKMGITIFLTNLAQSKYGNAPLVNTLLALATAPALRNLKPPAYPIFDISKGFEPENMKLSRILEACKVSFEQSPESRLAPRPHELDEDLMYRRQEAYEDATKLQVNNCLKALVRQWPSKDIVRPNTSEIQRYLPYLNAKMGEIQSMFDNWRKNSELQTYFENIQDALNSLPQPQAMPASYSIPYQEDNYANKRAYRTIDDLVQNPAPIFNLPQDELQDLGGLVSDNEQPEIDTGPSKLKSLLARLSRSANGHYQRMYIKDLQRSHNAFLATKSASPQLTPGIAYTVFANHLVQCKEKVESMYKKICSRMIVSNAPLYESARHASLLPRLSPSILLRLLASLNTVELSAEWKLALTYYALAIAFMQKAERLVACGQKESDILSELTNDGHTNWDPMESPDWLLLEIETNILIRPEQVTIAREMIAPQSGSNSIMQLNMGLGKSSVIVPIVAATLANGKMLSRVVVLRALFEQMFVLLKSRLGGLIGRRVYQLPISRSLAPTSHSANLIQKTYQECMKNGGILLVQPEDLLSFELLGIDYLLSRELNPLEVEKSLVPRKKSSDKLPLAPEESPYEIGKVMVQTQQWLYQHARDILDESDEILSVKFELIYTLGIQQNIQFSPNRWSIIQNVLGIVSDTALDMLDEFPEGLEVVQGSPGAFPRVRILHDDAGKSLLSKVAKTICRAGMPFVPMWTFTKIEKEVVLEYLTNLQISKSRAAILESKVLATESTKMSLLLLRGLFAAGVLEFVFAKKRWRVSYGLDLTRSMLAVPYHAKDNPSARSEFSHPDTAIALTCLSYYYGGLNDQQIQDSFEILFLSDNAEEDYGHWIQHCEDMPKTFKMLSSVNLRDKKQCLDELFPKIRYSKELIDYYLQHLVFPKEMREFESKVSSSGWEIAREKYHPTTGFSGTNDSKYMLPTPIKQCEGSDSQLATNAEVLACLLQPQNCYDTEYTPQMETLHAEALLSIAVAMQPQIRVLLDVGAQLLEDNEKIAESWLSLVEDEEVQAVIFFYNNDIFVLNREGMKEPLLISPFAKQMDRCLVYLDEAHTRGTDLKMPTDYRAIVTLGPDLTKDRLAQACKRLRKLGQGQSVVFVSPLEVQSKILEYTGKHDAKDIEVEDVLLWTMRNSWEFTKKGMPLWATQGLRHYRRRAACDLSGEVPYIPVGILEPEALTLDERYGLDKQLLNEGVVCRSRIQVDDVLSREEVCSIRNKCQQFGLTTFGDSDLHEEQERELQPENEREQQVELPPPTSAYQHNVHHNIRQLVLTGTLASNEGILPAFRVFDLTRARDSLDVDDWPQNLLMSEDFAYTVQIPNEGNKDSFLRPVNWILSFTGQDRETQYLILSPFEVQELLPFMRGHDRVRLHVYTPRLSLSNRSLEDLSFCAVPPVPGNWRVPAISTALNLFAGQLYLRDVREYRKLSRFLGIRFTDPCEDVVISTDGFISPETRQYQDDETAAICKFKQSPIDFLRLVTSFRRLGQTFTNSHMGKILGGELVKPMDFEVVESIEEDDDAMDIDAVVIKRERR